MGRSAATGTDQVHTVAEPRRATTFGLVALMSLMSFNTVAVATILPVVARELNAMDYYSWPLVAFFAFVVVGTVAAGRHCGRTSPLAVLVCGGAGLGVGLVIAGLAPSMAVLVAGRVLQGVGTGVVLVSTFVLIATVYPVDAQPRMFSLMTSVGVLPSLVGPPVAGIVAEYSSWRLVFLAWVPAVAAVLLLLRVTPLPPHEPPGGQNSWGAGNRGALVFAFLVAAGLTIVQFSANISIGYGLVLLVVSVALIGPALVRLLPPGTMSLRAGLPAVVAYRGLTLAPYSMITAFLPLIFTDVYGRGTAAVGLPLAVATVAWVVSAFAIGRFGSVNHISVIRFGCVQSMLSMLGIAVLLAVGGGPIWLLSAIYVVNSAVLGAAGPGTAVLLFRSCPEGAQASSSSAMMLSDAVSKVMALGLSGLVLTAFLTRGGSVASALALCLFIFAVIYGLAALLAGRLNPPQRYTPDERDRSAVASLQDAA